MKFTAIDDDGSEDSKKFLEEKKMECWFMILKAVANDMSLSGYNAMGIFKDFADRLEEGYKQAIIEKRNKEDESKKAGIQ